MQRDDEAARLATKFAGPRRLVVGTMGLAGVYGPVPTDIARQTIRAALDSGVALFDTAPLYGNGTAEHLLGSELAGQDAAIVTKFGLAVDRNGKLIRDSRPASIRRSVETSLRRLRRDQIDILLQHRSDPEVADAEVAGVMQRLVEEGKVAQVGLSDCSLARATKMGAAAPIRAIQNELSAASEILPGETAADFSAAGLLLMAYSPLARGLLARTQPRLFPAGDHRASIGSLGDARQTAMLDRAVPRLSRFANMTRPQAAIRWVLDQGANVLAVLGARSPEHIREIFQD